MDYVAKTLEAYNSNPEKYETSTRPMVLASEIDKLIGLLLRTDKPVLDAGCAYGRDCEFLASRGLKPVGIDMSSALVKRAKQLYPEFDIQQMDVRELDFRDDYFAGIWCNAVLLHLNDNDIRRALSEFNRVIIPGGAVCVSFKLGSGASQVVETFSSNDERYYNFKTIEATESLLREAGFEISESYILNERDRFGAKYRDLNWVYAFAIKSPSADPEQA